MSDLVDEIVAEVRRLPGVEEVRSRWGDPAFAVGGREFFHVDRDGHPDVRLTRELIRDLDDERALHRRHRSDWVWLRVEGGKDLGFALEVVHRAWQAAGGPPR